MLYVALSSILLSIILFSDVDTVSDANKENQPFDSDVSTNSPKQTKSYLNNDTAVARCSYSKDLVDTCSGK